MSLITLVVAYTRPTATFSEVSMQSQTRISGTAIFWRSFKWGDLIPEKSTFRVVPRTNKNIFNLFNGLGMNEEILFMLRDLHIKFIEVPFNNSILSATVEKWIKEGIRSRYADDRVDRQIILPIAKINLEETKPQLNQTSQLSLFGGFQQ